MMAWIVVNPNGEYRLFVDCTKPVRTKEFIKIKCGTSEDYYGNQIDEFQDTSEYNEVWSAVRDSNNNQYYGKIIDKSVLSDRLQSLTWKSEPIEI